MRALAAWLAVAITLAALDDLLGAKTVLASVVALVVLVLLNVRFIQFSLRKRGLRFAVGAFASHQMYYLYSSITFALATLQHIAHRNRGRRHVDRSG